MANPDTKSRSRRSSVPREKTFSLAGMKKRNQITRWAVPHPKGGQRTKKKKQKKTKKKQKKKTKKVGESQENQWD